MNVSPKCLKRFQVFNQGFVATIKRQMLQNAVQILRVGIDTVARETQKKQEPS